MMRKCYLIKGLLLLALLQFGLQAPPASARPQQQEAKPTYTIPEYNAFQAARAETNSAKSREAAR